MDFGCVMRAMILCAGYGTRLGSLTQEIPKPMLPIAGKPLLEYIVANLARHGFREIAINLHFKPKIIQEYFGDGSKWGVWFEYAHEPELLGTAGGVKRMEGFLSRDDCFMVHYGDVLTDQDFSAMLDFHRDRKALGTLLVHKRAKSNSVVTMDRSGRITCFLERPEREVHVHGEVWVNSGVCVLSRDIFNHIPQNGFSDLPRDVFSQIAKEERLFGYPLTGYRCAIDSPERYEDAQRAIIKSECRIRDVDSAGQ